MGCGSSAADKPISGDPLQQPAHVVDLFELPNKSDDAQESDPPEKTIPAHVAAAPEG